MRIKKTFFILAIAILLCGCSPSLLEDINTNNFEPTDSNLDITNFESEYAITLKWDADPGTDEYILYRDTNPDGVYAEIVYQGTELTYTDTDVEDVNNNVYYYYKLAKKRESKIFEKSSYVVGAASSVRNDQYEFNEVYNKAASFDNKTEANIYYFRDGFGNELVDNDWYSIEIEPKKVVTLEITNLDNLDISNDIFFMVKGEIKIDGPAGGGSFTVTIENAENTKETMYFLIGIDKEDFTGIVGGTGGRIGYYEIHFIQEENIVP
ncbi:MAG: hypothetical protein MJB14_24095 [Spirochaetes bacterium]|nr:hypothetical protein [Spirochaetota bacterium]